MDLATLFIVGFVGAITPGPDILLVLQNTLRFGLWQGLKALCGIASGWIIFLSIIYFGFAHVLSGEVFQLVLSFGGGLYLLYVAYLLARSKGEVELDSDISQSSPLQSNLSESSPLQSDHSESRILESRATTPTIHSTPTPTTPTSAPASFYKALFINLSNPKAILFFSVVIAPFMEKDLELSLLVLFTSLVGGFLSVILLAARFSQCFGSAMFLWIDRICACLFALFATLLLYQAFEIWCR